MARGLDSYARGLKRYAVLTKEQEIKLGAQLVDPKGTIASRNKARELLICHNLRFALKEAHKWARKYRQDLDDMIQVANEGLMYAVGLFDPSLGYRLNTFAVHCIRSKLNNFCISNWSIVRFGTTNPQRAMFFKLRGLLATLRNQNPDVTDDELLELAAAEMKFPVQKVRESYQRLYFHDTSLQAIVYDDSGVTMQDMISSPLEDMEGEIDRRRRITHVASIARKAARNARDAFIIERRILARDPMTLERIGSNFKNRNGRAISRERMRQIQENIIERIKQAI